jgi:hypothetical protein
MGTGEVKQIRKCFKTYSNFFIEVMSMKQFETPLSIIAYFSRVALFLPGPYYYNPITTEGKSLPIL